MDEIEELKRNLDSLKITSPAKKDDIASILFDIGAKYEERKELDNALKYYKESLNVEYKLTKKNYKNIAITLNNIGLVYMDLHKYKEAKDYLKDAIEIKRKKSQDNLATTLSNLALVYKNLGEDAKALNCYLESNDIRKMSSMSSRPDYSAIATTAHHIGRLYKKLGKYDEAVTYYIEALENDKRHLPEDHELIIETCNSIGNVLKAQKKYREALEYFRGVYLSQQIHMIITLILSQS